MTATDRLVANAADYFKSGVHDGERAVRPALQLAVVSCMDSRIDLFSLLGLRIGDAHMIRNAGGLISEDAVRSLAISQRFLGTREIVLIHHSNCGLEGLDDEKLAADLEAETGSRPSWRAGGFTDPAEDVRRSVQILKASPFIPHRDSVRGFVFDVHTGELIEVDPG
ncbi:MAG TPA: carbonic anhydrase [Acidimicrobiales bacterium]|nr:carbonic anhydrase [Acidimicrobiales bacterium]